MSLGKARVILFDFDGTLVHQTVDFDLMRRLVLGLVSQAGLCAEDYAGMYVLELIERVAQELGRASGSKPESFRQEAQAAVLGVELDAARHAVVFPGVPELLVRLRQAGYGIGVVTRNCRVAVELVLAKEPLDLDILLTRDDVTHTKPDPRHLAAALDYFCAVGAEAIMCGDHPMDILAGQRVGAATVAVLGDNPATLFGEVSPDLLVSCITEIADHLLV